MISIRNICYIRSFTTDAHSKVTLLATRNGKVIHHPSTTK